MRVAKNQINTLKTAWRHIKNNHMKTVRSMKLKMSGLSLMMNKIMNILTLHKHL